MLPRDNEALVREAHAAYNDHDFDRVVSYDADDHEWVTVATEETFWGAEGSKRYLRTWADAFPDTRTEITGVYAGDGSVGVEYTGRGTHEGTLRSSAGDIPPTGRLVEMRFCDVHQVRDGKIYRSYSYFDLADMLIQLGLMPALEGAEA